MKLYATGWLLLLIFTGSGMAKHLGDYESVQECEDAWRSNQQCFAKRAEKEKASGKPCLIYCGQPIGFCLQGERLTMPGVIFPSNNDSSCD